MTVNKKKRELAKLWTLLSELTTGQNWRKAKREIRTKTLLESWKIVERKSDNDISCICRARYSHQRIGTGNGGLGNKRVSGDHPNYSIVESDQNTEKSPGDLRRLEETCSHSDSSDKLSVKTGVKSSSEKIIIIIIIIYSFRVSHISISWWLFTGVWVTASFLKSPGLFSVSWPF